MKEFGARVGSPRGGIARLAAIVASVVLGGTMAASVAAQDTVVVGRSARPSVAVDLSVLDDMGQPPNVAQILMRHSRAPLDYQPGVPPPRNQITLRPPGSTATQKSRTTSKAAASTPARPSVTAAPPRDPAESSRIVLRPPVADAPSRPQQVAALPIAPPTNGTPPPPAAIPMTAPPATPAPPPASQSARTMPLVPPPAAIQPPAAPIQPPPATTAAPAPPAPAPAQIASLPPASATSRDQTIQLVFDATTSQIDDNAKRGLDQLVKSAASDPDLQLQLVAFASGTGPEGPSQARRLSLSRALAVRSYLVDKGVRSTRIDVRALGNRPGGGPADRVDVVVTKR